MFLFKSRSSFNPSTLTPQFWHRHRRHSSDRHRSRHLSSCEVQDHLPEAIKLHAAILSNGEIDIGDINLTEMDPEDIRVSCNDGLKVAVCFPLLFYKAMHSYLFYDFRLSRQTIFFGRPS